jgi:hypothetical protein
MNQCFVLRELVFFQEELLKPQNKLVPKDPVKKKKVKGTIQTPCTISRSLQKIQDMARKVMVPKEDKRKATSRQNN